MAGASADGELNPWPAFVDVLTTVIMVVTFLLVIMSAAVMMLSQRVVAQFKQQLLEATHSTAKPGNPAARPPISCPVGHNPVSSPDGAQAGTSISQLGSVLKSETLVNGRDQLSLRTRETKDTMKVAIKAIEEADNTKGVAVKTSDTLLNISFEPKALNYDPENATKMIAFLKAHANPGVTYEVWSFVPQVNSVSEAQRIAFYRAAMTRNMLVRAGIKPSSILTQIRLTDPKSAEGHNVRVVLKP